MSIFTVEIIGNVHVEPGQTITVDHIEDVFVLKVRSMQGVGVEKIKDLIQQKHEVVSIEKTESKSFCHPPAMPDFSPGCDFLMGVNPGKKV